MAGAPRRIDAGARVPFLARDRRTRGYRLCDGVATAAGRPRELAEFEADLRARRRHRSSATRPRSAATPPDHAPRRPVYDGCDERIRRAVGTAAAPPGPRLSGAAARRDLGGA